MKDYYAMSESLRDKADIWHCALSSYAKEDLSVNLRVIKRLSEIILEIWETWQSDTRHYQPSKKKYNWYVGLGKEGKRLLDPELPKYEDAKEMLQAYEKYVDLVVLLRLMAGMILRMGSVSCLTIGKNKSKGC